MDGFEVETHYYGADPIIEKFTDRKEAYACYEEEKELASGVKLKQREKLKNRYATHILAERKYRLSFWILRNAYRVALK